MDSIIIITKIRVIIFLNFPPSVIFVTYKIKCSISYKLVVVSDADALYPVAFVQSSSYQQ